MAQTDKMALRDHLGSLPRELYDIIFDYTFTPPSQNGVVTVDSSFKGAAASNVDRATNALLLERYSTCTVVGNSRHIIAGLKSFTGREKLPDVRCWVYESLEECLKSKQTQMQDIATILSLREKLQSELGMRRNTRCELVKEWALDDLENEYSFP
ncbi:hypothetical protein AC579_8964 [Pseudocercospora musae]|uniref:Uncharacterized protein n=1 Tax=Pseudocercospora musae TaxID=113226 RepID=A0A139I5S1_9PEZI|nr:hypothetical protein AC579_8964 [Pseudocercospora musae]KXT10091.1 hypothetical protein AC579_8964 [Pseudocercospora musae]KXT10092.1 hypothetical protein AC579_8964 [Pseudocercospora musae]KXT10096.1 hypothetical protein AC579_8964 [Pseudocercospora musae]